MLHVTAINMQILSHRESGYRAGQEHHRGGDILGGAQTSDNTFFQGVLIGGRRGFFNMARP